MKFAYAAISDSRAWDLATRLAAAGAFAFFGAAALSAALTNALHIRAAGIHTSVAAEVVAHGAVFVLLLIEATLVVARPRAIAKATGLQPRVSALLGTWLIALVLLLPVRNDLPSPLYITAAGLGALGDLLAIYVVLHLGSSFSIMAEARRVIAHGPYAIVRHPLYLAEEIGIASAIITHFSRWAIALLAVQAFFQFTRARNEERVLLLAFPGYADYIRRTPMLLPGLHKPAWAA